ncbi:MAG: tetratricopeptide repeat protein [Kiritimatiellae bacterium]|nr:tetratricopeptide repeat protein [Kiritimatiellia bacterium]
MSKIFLRRSLLTCGLLFTTAVLRAESVTDSDGDGTPDAADARPGLADFPLHWSVESLSFRWLPSEPEAAPATSPAPAWASATELTLFNRCEQGAVPGSRRGAALTASPFDQPSGGATASNSACVAFSLFGSGEAEWQTLQRVRAAQLALNTSHARQPARLEFVLALRNRGEGDCRIDRLRVPVAISGRRVADAMPADPAMRERGILVPAGTQVRRVVLHADISARNVPRLLDGMRSASPRLLCEDSAGSIAIGAGDNAVDLCARLRAIRECTVEVTVIGGDGHILVWRAARRVGRQPQRVADCFDALNTAGRERLGRALWQERDGFLTSLSGWDTGAWDRWWHVRRQGRGAPEAEWGRLPLDRDIAFELRSEPPSLSKRTGARLQALADDPVLSNLRGRLAGLSKDWPAAAEAYRRAADAGYAPAQSWLGYCYSEGQGVESNAIAAARHFKQAAAQGYAPGAAWLGRCHLRGHGVSRDLAAAASAFGEAAAQGHPEGGALYALCLLRGVGVKADADEAQRLLRRAAGQNGATAQLALGMQLLTAGAGEAVDWLRCAAAQGDAKAQSRLGRCLLEGEGVARNPGAAMTWFAEAAAQGDAGAQLALARGLRAGTGMRRNDRAAFAWFERAAAQGEAEAQVWLGMMLIEGRGTRRDAAAGVAWVRRAAERGHAQGQYLLGLCHYAGLGVSRNETEALQWLRRAAGQKVPAAQVLVGYCHDQGKGGTPDPVEAVRWYRLAAEQGYAAGQIWLASCYAEGRGVERDLEQARNWAQQAASQGHRGGYAMLRKLATARTDR